MQEPGSSASRHSPAWLTSKTLETQAERQLNLTIGPDADIRAEISAKTLVIMGTVTGNVVAAEKVDIGPSGTLVGDLVSPRLAIADGGCIRGKVQTPSSASAPGRT